MLFIPFGKDPSLPGHIKTDTYFWKMIRGTLIALLNLGEMQKQQPKVFYLAVLRNFAKFTGKQLCRSVFFNKLH